MKRTAQIAALTALLTLTIALAASAQTGALPTLIDPLVVTVDQKVPIQLTIADAHGLTTTLPLTVGVSIAITIHGDQLVDLAVAASRPAVAVAHPPGALVDNNGIPFSIEAPEEFAIEHLRSDSNYADNLAILGEITNNSGEDAELVKISITVYDRTGDLLDADFTFAEIETLEPGQTSTFETSTDAPLADVGSYKLQIQP